MTFSQFLAIIRARWVLIASIFSTVVALTLVVSLLLPKTYEAIATVMVDARPDPVSGMSMGGVQPSTVLATQVDIIKSTAVANRVVKNLALDTSPELRARWEKETKGRGDYTAWVSAMIAKGLEVKPSRESNVLDIAYDGGDPKFAAALANAFAQAYIDSTVQMRVDPARRYADFFEERTKLARAKLEEAQAKLTAMQKQKGIIVSDERLDVETQRLAELSTQLNTIRAMRAEASSRSTLANANPEKVENVVMNPLVAGMTADLTKEEAKLQILLERYGDKHPSVLEQRSTIAVMKDKLKSESGRVISSVSVSTKIADSRVSQAQAAYEDQRKAVMKLKDDRSELQVLEREVDSAQRIYDSIQTRLSQTSLESNSNQAGVYLLSPATEPTKHASPRPLINLIVAATFGLFLSLMVALGLEMLNPRVRGPQDVMLALELPVIGVLPSPNQKRPLLTLSRRLARRPSPAPLPKPMDDADAVVALS